MSTLNVDKVDPSTGTALEIGTSGDTITVPSGATFVVAGTTEITGTNNVQRPNANPLIINGDMQVAQRGTSTAGITGSNVLVVDRWRLDEGADATLTMSQEALTSGDAFDNGFKKSLKVLVTTADGSLAANQSEQLMQSIEAQDLQLLKFGTSNAVNLTLAFWYKSNITGIHTVCLDKADSTRTTNPVEFTVSVADTWEYKVLNFNSDATIQGSTGAIPNDNGAGLRVMWGLAYGTDYTSGTNGDWTQNGVADFSTSNQQNIVATNSNYVELTGVQLEVGEYTSATIPPFQHESYGDNLARCERYAYVISGDNQVLGFGFGKGSDNVVGPVIFPTTMRSVPTATTTTVSTGYKFQGSLPDGTAQDQNIDGSSNILEQAGTRGITYKMAGLSTVGGGSTGFFRTNSATAHIVFSSEL